jgi:hypothetical protein
MSKPEETELMTSERLARVVDHIQHRLAGRVRDLQISLYEQTLVLRGHAETYYAKQLAQHAIMEATSLPIRANEIEVSRSRQRAMIKQNLG